MKNEAKQIVEFISGAHTSEKSVIIENHTVEVKEYQGQRVVTFADIDRVHRRSNGTAGRNFRKNREHFISEVDYFEITRKDVATKFVATYGFDTKAPKGILLTESGYLMIVKSFTDDLSWEVQRALVNTYFRVKTGGYSVKPTDELRQKNIQIREQNAKIRTAQLLYKIADTTETDYRQVLHARITHLLTGEYLLPLPAVDERTYSAAEIGEKLGVTACRIGRLANLHGLKTAEYGKYFYDKAKTADKQVETFRYYEKAVDAFRKLVTGVAV